jgi:hypothetical protein
MAGYSRRHNLLIWMRGTGPPSVVLVLLFVVFGGCAAGDWERPLPNGYQVVAVSSGTEIVLVDPKGLVLTDAAVWNVDRVAVRDPWVIGTLAPSPNAAGTPAGATRYFCLDTRHGVYEQCTTEQEWRSALAAHSLTESPVLMRAENLSKAPGAAH